MKIVAEEEFARVLAARFGGERLPDDGTLAHEEVLVFADALFGSSRRAEHGGLEILERIIADGRLVDCRVAVAGFLGSQEYGEYQYLLDSGCYSQLPQFPSATHYKRPSEQVAKKAAARQLERICARIRHLFDQNARPAVRIALGAYCRGDISFEDLTTVLDRLRMRTRSSREALRERCSHLPDLLHRSSGAFPRGKLLPSRRGSILFIEDNLVARESWKHVLNAVFAGWARKGYIDRLIQVDCDRNKYCPRGREWNADALAALELVLLDYEIVGWHRSGHVTHGGDLLIKLKNRAFDLPVIIFTSSDEASLVKWCLPHGASDYFVKELPAKEDRESIAHYLSLREMFQRRLELNRLLDVDGRKASVRDIYHRYQERCAGHAQGIDRQQQADWLWINTNCPRTSAADEQVDSIDWHVRQAFRFLLSDGFWAEVQPLTQAYLHAYNAAELVLESLRARRMVERNQGGRNEGYLRWEWQLGTSLSENLKSRLLPTSFQRLYKKAPKHIPWHVDLNGPYKAAAKTIEEVLLCLRFTLDLIEKAYARLTPNGDLVRLPEVPKPLTPAPAVPTSPGRLSHRAQSAIAAREFLQQFEEDGRQGSSAEIGTPLRILFIDDMCQEDARWAEALRTSIVTGDGVLTSMHPAELSDGSMARQLRSYDIVLLDLLMPTANHGLSVLRQARKCAPEVPIVMFTSSRSSQSVRQALLEGANDYFFTRAGRSPTGQSRHGELVAILNSLERHWRSGALRRCFERILLVDSMGPVRGKNVLPNIRRMLTTAWDYLRWAEAGNRPSGLCKAWDQWLIDGLSESLGRRMDGCHALVLIHCGRVVEGLARLVFPNAQENFRSAIQKLDSARGTSDNAFDRVWAARNDAAHGMNDSAAWRIDELTAHLNLVIDLVQWFIPWYAAGGGTRGLGAAKTAPSA